MLRRLGIVMALTSCAVGSLGVVAAWVGSQCTLRCARFGTDRRTVGAKPGEIDWKSVTAEIGMTLGGTGGIYVRYNALDVFCTAGDDRDWLWQHCATGFEFGGDADGIGECRKYGFAKWGFGYQRRGGRNSRAAGVIMTAACPDWAILLLLACPMVCAVIRGRSNRYRRLHGLCLKCGYDLRAHGPGQRCPECGTPIPPGKNSKPPPTDPPAEPLPPG
jgi:hypothetical protein